MSELSLKQAAGAGAASGFMATIPMTFVMLLLHRLLPARERFPLPPEQMAQRLADETSDEVVTPRTRRAVALPMHFGFGAVSGALFGVSAGRTNVPPILSGIPFALLVWIVSYLGWIPAARILPPATDHPAGRNALMIVAHGVWGAATGSWFRTLTTR
jgi:hypothetical protein